MMFVSWWSDAGTNTSKFDRKDRAARGRIRRGKRAAVFGDYSVSEGKPNPVSRWFRREERDENLRQLIYWNSQSGITNFDHLVLYLYKNRSFFRSGFDGVAQDIQNGLTQHSLVSTNDRVV